MLKACGRCLLYLPTAWCTRAHNRAPDLAVGHVRVVRLINLLCNAPCKLHRDCTSLARQSNAWLKECGCPRDGVARLTISCIALRSFFHKLWSRFASHPALLHRDKSFVTRAHPRDRRCARRYARPCNDLVKEVRMMIRCGLDWHLILHCFTATKVS